MKRVLLLILLAFPHSLLAQTGSGGLSGTIVDASGAAVSEAKVTVVNEDSGAQVVTLANSEGLYRVPSLLPGSYRVEAAKTGFEKLVRRGLVVTTGQTVLADLTLKIGATSEIVTITESAPLTETQSQSVGQLINRRMVAGLPMPNRAASSLVALAPGVVMIDPGQGAENYPGVLGRGWSRPQPTFFARWWKRDKRLRADTADADDQPADGRDAGVPRHQQQLLSRVRPLVGRRYQSDDTIRR